MVQICICKYCICGISAIVNEFFKFTIVLMSHIPYLLTQRNRYPETGCNGAPSLSNMTDFYVNVT